MGDSVDDEVVKSATFIAYVAKDGLGVTLKDRGRDMKVEFSFNCIGQSYGEKGCLKLQSGYAQLLQWGYSVLCDDK